MNWKEILQPIFFYLPLLAIYIALKNYTRKSGISIKGMYSISSSAIAEDAYVNNIVLENNKDRAVIIFKIFLRVGHNYYIELNDFEHEPKILKPYESFTNSYGPVDFYSLNTHRVNLNSLLTTRKLTARIVLSTSLGKYVVNKPIKRWDPVFDFFKNHFTAYVIPMYPKEKIGHYGSEFKYLVKMTMQDGYKNTQPIYADDYTKPRFAKFMLTKDSLSSRDSLEEYLTNQAINGNLNCLNVEVIDAVEARRKNYGDFYDDVFEAKRINKLYYVVIGRLLTMLSNLFIHFENIKSRRKRNDS